mmetsp:Transcript_20716/g.42135  ORF Transcript_20716/g.42135 Transcript_20716/m.42135 type:complete len:248 (-) Transcript_20716:386-1129(-)
MIRHRHVLDAQTDKHPKHRLLPPPHQLFPRIQKVIDVDGIDLPRLVRKVLLSHVGKLVPRRRRRGVRLGGSFVRRSVVKAPISVEAGEEGVALGGGEAGERIGIEGRVGGGEGVSLRGADAGVVDGEEEGAEEEEGEEGDGGFGAVLGVPEGVARGEEGGGEAGEGGGEGGGGGEAASEGLEGLGEEGERGSKHKGGVGENDGGEGSKSGEDVVGPLEIVAAVVKSVEGEARRRFRMAGSRTERNVP